MRVFIFNQDLARVLSFCYNWPFLIDRSLKTWRPLSATRRDTLMEVSEEGEKGRRKEREKDKKIN